VQGKILVWDFVHQNTVTAVENRLPPEFVANSSEGKITIFAIVEQRSTVVGHYFPGGGLATQKYWDILVVYFPENKVVCRHTVVGDYPPSTITTIQGIPLGASGDIYGPTAEWITSLPMKP
jgi:hypothetical protein